MLVKTATDTSEGRLTETHMLSAENNIKKYEVSRPPKRHGYAAILAHLSLRDKPSNETNARECAH